MRFQDNQELLFVLFAVLFALCSLESYRSSGVNSFRSNAPIYDYRDPSQTSIYLE